MLRRYVLIVVLGVVSCAAEALGGGNAEAASTRPVDEVIWLDRIVDSVRDTQTPRTRRLEIGVALSLYPQIVTTPQGGILRKMVVEDTENGKEAEAIVELFDGKWAGASRDEREAYQALERMRREPATGHIPSVFSSARRAWKGASVDDPRYAHLLKEAETIADRAEDPRIWNELAAVYRDLAGMAIREGEPYLAGPMLDRMLEIFVRYPPVAHDMELGEYQDSARTARILLEMGREGDVERIAGAAEPAYAAQLWIAVVGHRAAQGDFDAAGDVLQDRLGGDESPEVREILHAAMEGRSPVLPRKKDLAPYYGATVSALGRISEGWVRRGEVKMALAVVDSIPKTHRQLTRLIELARAANKAGQAELAGQIHRDAWRRFQVAQGSDKPNELSLSKLAESVAEAGDVELMDEILKQSDAHELIGAMVTLAMRLRETDREKAYLLLRGAESRAARWDDPTAGIGDEMARVAAGYQEVGLGDVASNRFLRAVLMTESIGDPFYWGINDYGKIAMRMVHCGRTDLLDRAYQSLSRPADRAVFAVAALAALRSSGEESIDPTTGP